LSLKKNPLINKGWQTFFIFLAKYALHFASLHASFVCRRERRNYQPKQKMKITQSAKRAIKKYGIEVCNEAYALHEWGMGGSTVAWSIPILKGNTRAGDSAINAGRELAGK